MMYPFVERLFLSLTAHYHSVAHPRPNANMPDRCQLTCRFSYNFFLGTFFIGCDPQMYTVGVCLSCFDHRPGCYSTIDFWFGLENLSDSKSSLSVESPRHRKMFSVKFIVSVRYVVLFISTYDSCHACWAYSHVVHTMSVHPHLG